LPAISFFRAGLRAKHTVGPANFVWKTSKRTYEPPPLAFVRQISAADRVVVLEEGCAITTFIGADAAKFIMGLCSAHHDDRYLSGTFSTVLDFFKGTHLLLSTRFCCGRFYVGNTKYAVDRGGIVESLLAQRWSDPESYRAWTDTLAERLLQKSGCARAQDWSVALLQRYDRGELRTEPGLMAYPEIPTTDLPDWLQAALPGWQVYVVADAAGKPECLLLASHGIAGGLLIGPTDYVTNQQTFRLRWPKMPLPVWYIASPSPGIYAYHIGTYELSQKS
jgi:hypothetical protein